MKPQLRVTRRRKPQPQRFAIHGWIIIQSGNTAMTIDGPKGNPAICLFINKAHADKVLLSYPAGHEVKHYGLVELKN